MSPTTPSAGMRPRTAKLVEAARHAGEVGEHGIADRARHLGSISRVFGGWFWQRQVQLQDLVAVGVKLTGAAPAQVAVKTM